LEQAPIETVAAGLAESDSKERDEAGQKARAGRQSGNGKSGFDS